MACEICGRSSCTRSFHTIEEQDAFDEISDYVVENIKIRIKDKILRLDDKAPDNKEVLVSLIEVLKIIDNV